MDAEEAEAMRLLMDLVDTLAQVAERGWRLPPELAVRLRFVAAVTGVALLPAEESSD